MAVLFSILLGVVLGVAITVLRELWLRQRRMLAHWYGLGAEIKECARLAASGLASDGPKAGAAPLVRLPTVCYANGFPAILADGQLSEADANALLRYYNDVQALNRGLDLMDGTESGAGAEHTKATAARLAAPSGALYTGAMATVAAHIEELMTPSRVTHDLWEFWTGALPPEKADSTPPPRLISQTGPATPAAPATSPASAAAAAS